MKYLFSSLVIVGALVIGLPGVAGAQDAAAEKTLVANERAINGAFAKGDAATFSQYVASDGWAMDSMMGLMSVQDTVKMMPDMMKDLKITSWDLTDTKVQWVDANTAVLTYKWTGTGTYKGDPLPSSWCSTVYHKRGGKWTAVFHQESAIMEAPKK